MWYKDGKLYTENEIRAEYPNTSFPTPFVAPDGYEVVFDTPNPATTLQVGVQDGTEIDSKGNRVIKWSVRDKTAEELEAERKASMPKQVTPRQFELQLIAAGLIDMVENMCANDRTLKTWYTKSLDFQRDNPLVVEMAVRLGLSDTDVDNFFIEASKL